MRYKILLALPTALYAPIYLAKQLTLSKEFAHIDFEYPNPKQLLDKKRDELVTHFFDPFKNNNAIMLIADPMRVTFEEIFDNYYKPRIIQTLIDKMCYWAIGEYPKTKEDLEGKNYKLFVHPNGMTGYAITAFDLLEIGNNIEKEHQKKLVFDILYDKLMPGEERIFYNQSRNLQNFIPFLKRRKLGYITTEPCDILRRSQKEDFEMKSFIHCENNQGRTYCDAAMTSIITNNQCLKDKLKKKILINLIDGIESAIEFIYDKPRAASEILLRYNDSDHNVSSNKVRFEPRRIGWNEDLMYTFFEEFLKKEEIYPRKLILEPSQINNTKRFWMKSLLLEEDQKLIDKLNTIDNYLSIDWRTKID